MKIALPSRNDGNLVDEHFGHAESFTVLTISDDHQIVSQEIVPAGAACGCRSNIAGVLAEKGVSVMLAGNMGGGAVNVLTNYGIDVFRGCSGDVRSVTKEWLAGTVADSGVECGEHSGTCEH